MADQNRGRRPLRLALLFRSTTPDSILRAKAGLYGGALLDGVAELVGKQHPAANRPRLIAACAENDVLPDRVG
jgi:hypothetical protein